MHEITALELHLAIRELRGRMVGSFLKKFYDLGGDSFRFTLHSGNGNFVLYCNLLSSLNETGFVEEVGTATNFAIAMRRKIEDSKIIDFYQYCGDRIAIIEVQAHGEKHRIVIEMFGKGNLILIDQKDDIELCYKIMLYKDRTVKPKIKYVFPKSDSVDVERLDADSVGRILETVVGMDGKMIIGLSRYLNIGPVYLEDVITSAGLNPKDRLSEENVDALRKSILEFLGKIAEPFPIIYMKDGRIVDYAAFPLRKYEGIEGEECGSINQMLDKVNVAGRAEAANEEDSRARETAEIDAIIEKQRALIKGFEDDSARFAESARLIFERMGEINELIGRIQENKRLTVEELRPEFPDLNITELNMKDKRIAIEL